jgi:hypothetical protein
MILAYGRPVDDDGRAALDAFMAAFNKELADSGMLVETRELTDPVHARRVRLRDGVAVVTDGPEPASPGALSGYWVVECDSFHRATQLAARLAECPATAPVVADVRPVIEDSADLAR